MTEYISYVVTLVVLYSVLALSLDVLVGHLGLVALSQAAYFGVGGYAAAMVTNSFGANVPYAIGAAVCAGAISSFVVALSSLRLRGDYFVISAFAFQMLLFSLFNNLLDVTGGPSGLSIVGSARRFSATIDSPVAFLAIIGCYALTCMAILWRLETSRYGRVLHSIRDDEILAATLGTNTAAFKISAFALSAGMSAGAGGFYALYIRFIDPTSFNVFESVLILAMVLLCKPASLWGPVIGATTLVTVPELLRFTDITTAQSANFRQIIFGLILIMVIVIRGPLAFGATTWDER
jgi:ABC-type branched-subunit amino acid transport system permease subunit